MSNKGSRSTIKYKIYNKKGDYYQEVVMDKDDYREFVQEGLASVYIYQGDYKFIEVYFPKQSKYRVGLGKDVFARCVLGLTKGDGKIVDHINRNPFDCRKANLRVVTPLQNRQNVSVYKTSKLGIKGVFVRKGLKESGDRFCAAIQYKGCKIWLGSHKKLEDAIVAYNDKAKELFGVYAVLNDVDECLARHNVIH